MVQNKLRPPYIPSVLAALSILAGAIRRLGHVDAVTVRVEGSDLAGVQRFARDDPIDLCGGMSEESKIGRASCRERV